MKKLISGAIAAATLAGTAMTGTAASAQRWGGYHGGYGYGHRGYGTGALVGVGLLGLAAGVAIADRPRYYGGGYGPGYYRPAYGYGYAPGYAYGYGGCGTAWRYDPYVGHRVPVRRCW